MKNSNKLRLLLTWGLLVVLTLFFTSCLLVRGNGRGHEGDRDRNHREGHGERGERAAAAPEKQQPTVFYCLTRVCRDPGILMV